MSTTKAWVLVEKDTYFDGKKTRIVDVVLNEDVAMLICGTRNAEDKNRDCVMIPMDLNANSLQQQLVTIYHNAGETSLRSFNGDDRREEFEEREAEQARRDKARMGAIRNA